MIRSTCNGELFNETFNKIEHKEQINLVNNNTLDIYQLSIRNKKFDYLNLKSLITNNIKGYVYSRKEIQEAIEQKRSDELFNKARKKFRELKNENDKGAGGELGEILLYIFLENELKAYKLLSKMELKTNRNDYVKGADGVFLYPYNRNGHKLYDIVIGEAKMKDNIVDAIEEAFKSTLEHIEKIELENELINSNVLKETFCEEDAEEIMRIIVPSPKDIEKNVITSTAIGIFIGYSMDIDITKETNIEGAHKLTEKVKTDIVQIAKKLNLEIEKYSLQNYSFYVYIVPFNEAKKDRKEILEEIIG